MHRIKCSWLSLKIAMFNKRLTPSFFSLLRIQSWLLIGFIVPAAKAVSVDWCLRALQENARKSNRSNARPIGLNFVRRVFPHGEKYSDTLEKFEGFDIVRSGLVINDTVTWGIQGKYQKDRVAILLEVDGNQYSKVRVVLDILGKDDSLQHEMYFLIASTLSEAKAILGIAESDIVQVAVPAAKRHLPSDVKKPIYWSATYSIDRVAPTYGTLPPYAEEAELRLKFTELLIQKLEGQQYSASPLWKPDGLKHDIVPVGLNRVYLREVPSARPGYRRVALELGQNLRYQFAADQSKAPHLPPATHRGEYLRFLGDFLNDLDFFSVELAPPFWDSQGNLVDLNQGRSPLYFDVVANKDSQPVVWVRRILEGALKNYALD